MKSWHPTKAQKSYPTFPCLQQRSQAIHIRHTGAHEASGLSRTLQESIFGRFEELLLMDFWGEPQLKNLISVYLCVYRFLVFLYFCLVDFFARWVPITWFVAFFNGLADFTCISVRFLPNRILFFEGMCCFYLLSMPIPWRNKDS